MSYPLHAEFDEPAAMINDESGITAGAMMFKSGTRAIQILLSDGSAPPGPRHAGHEPSRHIEVSRYPDARAALRDMEMAGGWLLVYARHHASIVSRGAVLAIPERHTVLLRRQDVDTASLRGLRGTLLLMQEAAMSPHDRKLLARGMHAGCFKGAWGRLLGAYLDTLDAETLGFVAHDVSGWTLLEHQIMELLRRTLLEYPNGIPPWRRSHADGHAAPARGERLFKSICEWVAHNYHDTDLSSEVVASHFHVSPRYLQALFSKYGGGATFVSFVREKRLRRAWDALADAGHAHQTISDICWNCGFADPVYFGKSFREFFGITPSQARRQCGRQIQPD